MSNLKGKKVLITGADGFIGSHLVEALVKEGAHVRAFVFYNSYNSWGWLDTIPNNVKDKIDVFAGDIRDYSCVLNAAMGCEYIFNLAALIAIPYSYLAVESYIDTNVKGALNVLQAAREVDAKRVIQTSTSEVYGSAQFVPITESHPLNAQSPYAASKIGADQLALSFAASFNVPVVVLRPFNTYGPRQSARAVIPTVISQIASGTRKIKLGALHPTRDFSYVDDTVSGFIAAITAKNAVGKVINIGSSFEISIEDTAHLIADIMGIKISIISDAVRLRPDKSEVDRLFADVTLAKKLLDWSPQYAGINGLKKGLMKTADWFSKPKNQAYYKSTRYNT